MAIEIPVRRRLAANRHRSGFTITELIIVMIIIVLLAGLAVRFVPQRIDDGRRARTLADLSNVEKALDEFRLHVGRYPTQSEGLFALVEDPGSTSGAHSWKGPYLKRLPVDGWSNEFVYVCPGRVSTDFDLYSLGKDGKEGGDEFDTDLSTNDLN